ncbi:MAG: adenylate/guanylate cyclase domain-containing protein [Myxococcota bacterium]
MRSDSRQVELSKEIRRSRRSISVLFTDVADSTAYWERHGDIQGRLMVDLHNRLAFPVIRAFGGRVIKTIGDSIMASFKQPHKAVLAAIGIQQVLQRERVRNPEFELRVRIGVHTGMALVERRDVFGDTVNTAARVESEADADQILISEDTKAAVEDYEFHLVHAGTFKPKGKSKYMQLHRVPWSDFENVIGDIREGSYLPVSVADRVYVITYFLLGLVGLSAVFLQHGRFLIADRPELVASWVGLSSYVASHPWVLLLPMALLALSLFALLRMRGLGLLILRALTGTAVFSSVYLIAQFMIYGAGLAVAIPSFEQSLYESRYLMVEITVGQTDVFDRPDLESETLRKLTRGTVLPQLATRRAKGLSWNRVSLGDGQKGWVLRTRPAEIGVPEVRVSYANKYRFTVWELLTFIAAFLGLAFGASRTRIAPL